MTTTVTMWDWDDIYNTVKKKLRDFFHLEVEVDYYGFNTDDELQMFIGYPDTPEFADRLNYFYELYDFDNEFKVAIPSKQTVMRLPEPTFRTMPIQIPREILNLLPTQPKKILIRSLVLILEFRPLSQILMREKEFLPLLAQIPTKTTVLIIAAKIRVKAPIRVILEISLHRKSPTSQMLSPTKKQILQLSLTR